MCRGYILAGTQGTFERDLVGHNVRNVVFTEVPNRLGRSQALLAQICSLGIRNSKLCNRNIFCKNTIFAAAGVYSTKFCFLAC